MNHYACTYIIAGMVGDPQSLPLNHQSKMDDSVCTLLS